MSKFIVLALFFCISFSGCALSNKKDNIIVGAENFEEYLNVIKDKRVALLVNQTSLVSGTHLVDTLLSLGISLEKIFSPEHGFRGMADAGEMVGDSLDAKSGLKLVSLYGNKRKPTAEQMKGIDVLIFDLQDVGIRYFTYLSTLHYIMESCAENNVKLIILDRPNPNGFYVDGPVLEMENSSFVGIYPIPVVHGMTLGEMAQMAVEEGWVCKDKKLQLQIVKCKNYTHLSKYQLPIKPSPNLPDMRSIYLYPSICLFEGTVISEGRGTDVPFQLFGHPDLLRYDTTFTPRSILGASKYPKLENQKCYGYSLTKIPFEEIQQFTLKYLIDTYNQFEDKSAFFIPYFRLLAGNTVLQKQIVQGLSENDILDSWQDKLEEFKEKRKKHLLYPDFTGSL